MRAAGGDGLQKKVGQSFSLSLTYLTAIQKETLNGQLYVCHIQAWGRRNSRQRHEVGLSQVELIFKDFVAQSWI